MELRLSLSYILFNRSSIAILLILDVLTSKSQKDTLQIQILNGVLYYFQTEAYPYLIKHVTFEILIGGPGELRKWMKAMTSLFIS